MAGPDGTIRRGSGSAGGVAMLANGLSEVYERAIRSVVAADFRDVAETAWRQPVVFDHGARAGSRRRATHTVRGRARVLQHARRSTLGSAATTKQIDLEGRCWKFSRHSRDISPADWGARRLREALGQSRSMTRPSYAASTPARRDVRDLIVRAHRPVMREDQAADAGARRDLDRVLHGAVAVVLGPFGFSGDEGCTAHEEVGVARRGRGPLRRWHRARRGRT